MMKLPLDAFRSEMVPAHFFMNFRTVDEHGRMLGQSRNLQELRSRYASTIEQTYARAEVKEKGEEGKGAVLAGLLPGASANCRRSWR
jgi:ATP-dependent helicase HrpA